MEQWTSVALSLQHAGYRHVADLDFGCGILGRQVHDLKVLHHLAMHLITSLLHACAPPIRVQHRNDLTTLSRADGWNLAQRVELACGTGGAARITWSFGHSF